MEAGRKFYDEGWNARCRGEPLERPATRDYVDGWRDCYGASVEDRVLFQDVTSIGPELAREYMERENDDGKD